MALSKRIPKILENSYIGICKLSKSKKNSKLIVISKSLAFLYLETIKLYTPGLLIILGLIALILSPIASRLIQLAVSRRREYLADATSVQMTRNPDAMISALEKISSDDSEMYQASQSSAHMFISNPFKGKKLTTLLQTHPAIEDRIEAIEKLRWLTFFD